MPMRLVQSGYAAGEHAPIPRSSEVLAMPLQDKLSSVTKWFTSFSFAKCASTSIVNVWCPQYFHTSLVDWQVTQLLSDCVYVRSSTKYKRFFAMNEFISEYRW